MEKIQVTLNMESGHGVVYVVTLEPIYCEGGAIIQDDKMRVYVDEENLNISLVFS